MITVMAQHGTPAEEPAHDVLAAEAFAMPAPDPELDRRPVLLPDDPTGIPEPHDVLAAEEFPMPAPRTSGGRAAVVRPGRSPAGAVVAAAVALALYVLLRSVRRS